MNKRVLDHSSVASDPGAVRLSDEKLRRIQPEFISLVKWLGFLAKNPTAMFVSLDRASWKIPIAEHLMYGDSRAAVVISVSPLLIAAYTDELDCIALLKFEAGFGKDYDLSVGSRLITINTYLDLTDDYEEDLIVGKDNYGRYGNFSPFIAEFLTEDIDVLENRKRNIDESEWLRTKNLGEEYAAKQNARARDGRPLYSIFPAKLPVKS